MKGVFIKRQILILIFIKYLLPIPIVANTLYNNINVFLRSILKYNWFLVKLQLFSLLKNKSSRFYVRFKVRGFGHWWYLTRQNYFCFVFSKEKIYIIQSWPWCSCYQNCLVISMRCESFEIEHFLWV